MSQFARVESVDALREFKVALIKFAESARSALTDAESELQRSLNWVQNEQRTYWQGQTQKRYQAMLQAREAMRQKLLFRSGLQSKDAAAEERQALNVAQRAYEEARAKADATRAWGTKLAQEAIVYRGLAQRLANQTDIRLPQAASVLEQAIQSLETYLALESPEIARSAAAPGSGASGVESGTAQVSESVRLAPADSALPDTAPPPSAPAEPGVAPPAPDSPNPAKPPEASQLPESPR